MAEINNIYMDNAASTKPCDDVITEMIECATNIYGNPSSMHEIGFEAESKIRNSSIIISEYLNCDPDELYYTSGATMSNNVAIQGWFRKHPDGVFVYSSTEHNDIIILSEWLRKQGKNVVCVPVDYYGIIDKEALEEILQEYDGKDILVSIHLANSETGVVQDIKGISSIVHRHNGILHTDATQYIAYNFVDVQAFNIDMMSMSGQKVRCIKGIGLLYIKKEIEIDPLIFGEQGLIGGTENVIGIACLSKAFSSLYQYDVGDMIEKQSKMIDGLTKVGGKLVGSRLWRLPNNICMMFDGVKSEVIVQHLNSKGIYISSGSACSSHNNEPSHVLLSMGYSDKEAESCIRITINRETTLDEINIVINTIGVLMNLLGIIKN